jgi:hypothetical protein
MWWLLQYQGGHQKVHFRHNVTSWSPLTAHSPLRSRSHDHTQLYNNSLGTNAWTRGRGARLIPRTVPHTPHAPYHSPPSLAPPTSHTHAAPPILPRILPRDAPSRINLARYMYSCTHTFLYAPQYRHGSRSPARRERPRGAGRTRRWHAPPWRSVLWLGVWAFTT